MSMCVTEYRYVVHLYTVLLLMSAQLLKACSLGSTLDLGFSSFPDEAVLPILKQLSFSTDGADIDELQNMSQRK